MQLKSIIIVCLAGMAMAVPINFPSEAGSDAIVEPSPLCEFKRDVQCGNSKRSKDSGPFTEEVDPLTPLAEFKRHTRDLEEASEPSPFIELRETSE
ncbi:hypothetical protein BOTCAL_0398g00010 [Botryotinia calthae]|uniref:Uncharacterized protein n=1 Tax=Botryotinia calthae TaxID=38488 RepID=A0A4Y8CQI1_9HELO|nr:hypothetical protein BOTCAL_0398g00010 [Botryotinia calthae]